MRVKFKRWAVDYLDESKENQFNLLDEDKDKLSSFINEKKLILKLDLVKVNLFFLLQVNFQNIILLLLN